MSYDYTLVFEEISRRLYKNPHGSIGQISLELGISRRTIQNVLQTGIGKSFSELRQEILMLMVRQLLVSRPGLAIKEVSFAVGFSSTRSFGRTVKRACGLCPQELRSALIREHRPEG